LANHSVRYAVISPVRNEERFIARTIESMCAQRVLPETWIIVDDGSTDSTTEIVTRCVERYPFVRLLSKEQGTHVRSDVDRLAWAAEARAFNCALRELDLDRYDFVAKLDGDVSFGPHYFEQLLRQFANNRRLGIAGGHCYEERGGSLVLEWVPESHVRGATKVYRTECFLEIGGIEETLGWDTMDELKAQMRGWQTRSFSEPKLVHHRPTGSASGTLRGKARHGEASYILGYHPLFALARGLRLMTVRPHVAGGVAFIWGFVRSYVTKPPRIKDPEATAFLRRQQLRRLLPGTPRARSADLRRARC